MSVRLVAQNEPLGDRAAQAGSAWAAQFETEGHSAENLRGLIANAFAAGWINGYQAGVTDCKKIVDGAG